METAASANQRLPLDLTARDDAVVGEGGERASSFSIAMFCAIVFRAVIFSLGVLSVYTAQGALDPEWSSGHPWVAWDGNHYHYLILNGYAQSADDHAFPLIAFFPMLPLVARPLTLFMSGASALVLIANLCSLVGFGFLYSWARQLAGPRVAILCVLILATFPGAVFFSAALTEGPFFMLVTIALWMLQRGKYWPAAIIAAIATATRPTGIALALLVPLYYFAQHPQLPFLKRAAMFVVLGFVSSLGGMIYQGFIWHRYERFDAYFHAQETWEIADKNMVQQEAAEGMQRYSMRFFMDRVGRPQAWNRIVALGLVVITVVGFFRPGPIPRLFFLVPLLIFLMTYLPNNGLRSSSIIRYETAGVPIFVLAAWWISQMRHRGVLLTLLSIQFLMQCYYAILFSRGSWVG